MKQLVGAGLIVLAAVGLFLIMGGIKRDRPRRPPQPLVRTVSTTTVRYGPVSPTITATGRVRAEQRVQLTPQVSGTILQSGFRLLKGTSFHANQILMRIDNRQALYTLQTTISELQNALAGLLPVLKTDIPAAYERWSAFFAAIDGADVTIPQLPATESEREKLLVTRYNIYKLYYTARNQQVALAQYILRAPFSGTVEEASVHPASMARGGGAAVAVIARTDRMEVELALSPANAARVSPGMAAAVSVEGTNRPAAAVVHRVGQAVDERMQTVPVFVRIDNAAKLGIRSGAYATVTLAADTLESAMAIPRKALHDRNRVYLIEDSLLTEREVAVVHVGAETAYISSGPLEGATLIVEPLQDAAVGMAVAPAGSGVRAGGAPARTPKPRAEP
jgi:membrane fusion protein, multidrug efflux system